MSDEYENRTWLTKDEEDTRQHPNLDGRETLGLGGVGRDVVEDVDQHEEEGDQQSHPTCGEKKIKLLDR